MALRETFGNGSTTSLSVLVTDGTDNHIHPTSTATFPGTGQFRVRVDDELMIVTDASVNPWPVTRGVEGTTPVGHGVLTVIEQVITAAALLNLADQIRQGLVTKAGAIVVHNGQVVWH